MKCERCHEREALSYTYFCYPCLEMLTTPLELQDHYTLPEEKEEKAGYGWLNFNWIMKPFKEAVEWHDKVTTRGSAAQRAGIPDWRIARAWRDMLDTIARDCKESGFVKRTAWAAGFTVARLNRYFYEGPLVSRLEKPEIKTREDRE